MRSPYQKRFAEIPSRESMAEMGLTSRAFDKLPDWAKILLGICGIAGMVYGLVQEGPIFLLKALLKPVP
jgi:hypothetical protein